MKKVGVVLLLVSLNSFAFPQSNFRIKGDFHYGFIIPHAAELKMHSHNIPFGFSLAYNSFNTSKRSWESCNCFHFTGFQLNYTNFGNTDVLGESFAFVGTFDPIFWRQGSWMVHLNSGIGPTWLTRTYHPENNPDNRFFSTNISFLVYLGADLQFQLNSSWAINLGFNYNHISNGGVRQPNRGMNFPQGKMGVSGFINYPEFPTHQRIEPEYKWKSFIQAGLTSRKTGNEHQRRPVISMVFGTYRPVAVFSAFGGGFEAIDDFSIPYREGNGKYTLAPFISHNFLLGKFTFSQHMSYYAIRPDDVKENRFYQRYTIVYNFSKNFGFGGSMKTHGFVAAYIEFRFQYNL